MSFVLYKLTKSERSDLDRNLKNLAMKTAQVICQARQGEKVNSACEPNPTLRNYWFNIAITDHADVNGATRRALGLKEIRDDRSIVQNLPLCVEITLQTEDSYDMLLECWTLSIIQELNSPAIRASHNVYSSFGNLLKSIIAVSRATPAYKLSRRTSESYRIKHSITAGKPADLNRLGEDYKQFRIGQTCTVFGTVNMAVAYRTKMTISPTQTTGRDAKIMLKSDHFLNDMHEPLQQHHQHQHQHQQQQHQQQLLMMMPTNRNYYNARNNEKQTIDLDKPLRLGALADITQKQQRPCPTEEDHILPETPPFSWLLKKTQEDQAADDVSLDGNRTPPAAPATPPAVAIAAAARLGLNRPPTTEPIDMLKNNAAPRHTAAAAAAGHQHHQHHQQQQQQQQLASPRSLDERRRLSDILLNDENPLLFNELLLPFATESTPLNDLARFFRDLNNLPPISLEQQPEAGTAGQLMAGGDSGSSRTSADSVENNTAAAAAEGDDAVVDDLTRRLEGYETHLNDYESLVTSLCSASEIDSNSNS